mmetsp:Transcript_28727/g.43418  ORF Transcript_28727/g.43418 Transcript_28727/m.43418 type:complete len:231 (+) Transcript_28727:713-1405(+)
MALPGTGCLQTATVGGATNGYVIFSFALTIIMVLPTLTKLRLRQVSVYSLTSKVALLLPRMSKSAFCFGSRIYPRLEVVLLVMCVASLISSCPAVTVHVVTESGGIHAVRCRIRRMMSRSHCRKRMMTTTKSARSKLQHTKRIKVLLDHQRFVEGVVAVVSLVEKGLFSARRDVIIFLGKQVSLLLRLIIEILMMRMMHPSCFGRFLDHLRAMWFTNDGNLTKNLEKLFW